MFKQTHFRSLPNLHGLQALQDLPLAPAGSREQHAAPDGPPASAASHLQLPVRIPLTPAERKACFGEAAHAAAGTPPQQPAPAGWTLAGRTARMTSSAIRDLLKLTERPGIISLAGGLPAADSFPVQALARACEKVLGASDAGSALQYAATEGLPALRQAVAASLPWPVDPGQVLITSGSQQGLDLVAKVLVDPGSRILVEVPTYLGALQAFQPMEPTVVGVDSDEYGMRADDFAAKARGARFVYLLPNFQNPTGRTMDEQRRQAIADAAARAGVPVLEDNPYGELWFDTPPPAPMAARHPDNTIYLGSFSKVLAPGLRLGFLVAPPGIYRRLVMAKQAADLQSATFNQRVVVEMLQDGFLERHLPAVRARYKAKRDTMLRALEREMRGLGVTWNRPAGGMFFWLRLPPELSATALLPRAVGKGVAFVPGAPFHAGQPDDRALRLSFVTATPAQIDAGVAALAAAVREAGQVPTLPGDRVHAPA